MADTDWWRSFFTGPWSRIQAAGYSAEQTAAECDLIRKVLSLEDGARVLDIPCGLGRHCVELARRGYRVTGVDFNPESIEAARASATAAGVRPQFVVADMRRVTFPDRLDAAFCFFGSFGYFTEDGNVDFARAVAASLRPGGRFLIEGHLQETLLPIFSERDSTSTGPPGASTRVLEERSWDPATHRVNVTWTMTGEAGAQSSSSSVRLYDSREIRDLLQRAGFVEVTLLDGKTGQPFRPGSARALVVART